MAMKGCFSSPNTGSLLLFFGYFLLISGFIYDLIMEPPSMGSVQDPTTGTLRPVAFQQGRVTAQYLFEGITGGFMCILGSFSFLLLERATHKFM
jgi:hypothetical protein